MNLVMLLPRMNLAAQTQNSGTFMLLLLAIIIIVVIYYLVRYFMGTRKRQDDAGARKVASSRQDAANVIMNRAPTSTAHVVGTSGEVERSAVEARAEATMQQPGMVVPPVVAGPPVEVIPPADNVPPTGVEAEPVVIPERSEEPILPPATLPDGQDNLEIIEGIGPKIAGVLNRAGITTFAALADMQPSSIKDILDGVGLRIADPRSWPEQARLAAAGDMAGLKTLQDHLKAGRQV